MAGAATTAGAQDVPAGQLRCGVANIDAAAFTDKLASLPLLYKPATVWTTVRFDMLGLTVEQISKQSLDNITAGNSVYAARNDGHRILSYLRTRPARTQAVAVEKITKPAKPQARAELTQAAQIRMRRGCAGSTHRVSALCDDADERRTLRRSANARPQESPILPFLFVPLCCPTS